MLEPFVGVVAVLMSVGRFPNQRHHSGSDRIYSSKGKMCGVLHIKLQSDRR